MSQKRPPLPPAQLIDRLDLIRDRVEDAHRELNGLMDKHYLGGMPGSCCGRTRSLLKSAMGALDLAAELAERKKQQGSSSLSDSAREE